MTIGSGSQRGGEARSIGQLVGRRDRGRDGKVRRNSVDVADERARAFILVFDEDENAACMEVIQRYNVEEKEDGRYVGPLRGRGPDVYRYLWQQARRGKGRCWPSHAQIAAALRIGVRTVSRIMKALFMTGWLEWIRRSIEVEGEEGGVRREQTSNAYRFNVPAKFAAHVRRIVARRAGANFVTLKATRVIGTAELEQRPYQWERSLHGDGRLAAVLARIAAAVDRTAGPAKLAVSEG